MQFYVNWNNKVVFLFFFYFILQYSYDYVPVSDGENAKYGSVQAGLNQIDISTLGIVPTIDRSQIMEFSYPLAIESFKLLVPKPEESHLFAFVRPFQFSVKHYHF